MRISKRRDDFAEHYAEYRAAVDGGKCPVIYLDELSDWMHPIRLARFRKYISILERGSIKSPLKLKD